MAIPSKSGRMWVKLAPPADLPNHTHWEWGLRGWFSLTSSSEPQCRAAWLMLRVCLASVGGHLDPSRAGVREGGQAAATLSSLTKKRRCFSCWILALERWLLHPVLVMTSASLGSLRISWDASGCGWMVTTEKSAPGQLSLTNRVGTCSQPLNKKWSPVTYIYFIKGLRSCALSQAVG